MGIIGKLTFEEIAKIFSDPTMAAIIGGAVGAIAAFVPTALMERRKAKQFKNNIKRLVRIELEQYDNFLARCIKQGTDNTKTIRFNVGNEMRKEIFETMDEKQVADVAFFLFRHTNYGGLSAETKSQVFDNDKTLIAMEKAYETLETFQMIRGNEISHYDIYFQKDKGTLLKKQIEDALKMIKP